MKSVQIRDNPWLAFPRTLRPSRPLL